MTFQYLPVELDTIPNITPEPAFRPRKEMKRRYWIRQEDIEDATLTRGHWWNKLTYFVKRQQGKSATALEPTVTKFQTMSKMARMAVMGTTQGSRRIARRALRIEINQIGHALFKGSKRRLKEAFTTTNLTTAALGAGTGIVMKGALVSIFAGVASPVAVSAGAAAITSATIAGALRYGTAVWHAKKSNTTLKDVWQNNRKDILWAMALGSVFGGLGAAILHDGAATPALHKDSQQVFSGTVTQEPAPPKAMPAASNTHMAHLPSDHHRPPQSIALPSHDLPPDKTAGANLDTRRAMAHQAWVLRENAATQRLYDTNYKPITTTVSSLPEPTKDFFNTDVCGPNQIDPNALTTDPKVKFASIEECLSALSPI